MESTYVARSERFYPESYEYTCSEQFLWSRTFQNVYYFIIKRLSFLFPCVQHFYSISVLPSSLRQAALNVLYHVYSYVVLDSIEINGFEVSANLQSSFFFKNGWIRYCSQVLAYVRTIECENPHWFKEQQLIDKIIDRSKDSKLSNRNKRRKNSWGSYVLSFTVVNRS